MTPPSNIPVDLKPCPFCGGEAHIQKYDSCMFVCCLGKTCLCAVGENYDSDGMPDHAFYDEEVAAAAWNTRAAEAHVAELEQQVASLSKLVTDEEMEGIKTGLDDIARGRTRSFTEIKRELKTKYGEIPKRPVVYNHGEDVIDPECLAICDALNLLLGIETISSCCGHGYAPFRVYFTAQTLDDLRPILELIDESELWSLRTSMATGGMRIYFVLEGKRHDGIFRFAEADKLAALIAARAAQQDAPQEGKNG